LVFNVGTLELAESFETLEKLIHRLFADSGALGQGGGANAIGARILKSLRTGETRMRKRYA
jgi:hypothetical protein